MDTATTTITAKAPRLPTADMPMQPPIALGRRSGRPSASRSSAQFNHGSSAVAAGLALLILFNLALPKGGLRIGEFPLTWGYAFLGVISPFAAAALLRRSNISLQPIIQTGLFAIIAAMVYIKAQAYGSALAEWLAYFVLFGVVPAMILAVMSHFLEDVKAERIASLLRWAIRIAVVWGIFNFFLHLTLKQFIEIPYITVNGDEVGATLGKNNMRGSVMKLVSTFNNGNIFGVCMVMLAPVYLVVERRRQLLALFVLAVLLSLSRTAWFGLAAAFILMVLGGQIRVTRIYAWVAIAGATASLLLILPLLGWTAGNIFDSDLGGRIDTLESLKITVLGGPSIHIPELVYAGLLQSFGVVGFTIAVAALGMGPIYGLLNWRRLSPLRRAATLGCLAYLAECLIDGAFVFPPTFVIYLFLTSLIYRRGFRAAAVAIAPPPPRGAPLARRQVQPVQHAGSR